MAFIVYSCLTSSGKVEWRDGSYESVDVLYDDLIKRNEVMDRFYVLPDFVHTMVVNVRGRLNPSQMVEFCTYLSLYIQGGLDLQTALTDLASSAKEANVRQTAEAIQHDLREGISLSQAMARTKQFQEIVVSMVQIGETSGNLDQMLTDAAEYLKRVDDIRSATKRALLYPAFTMFMLMLTGLFWLTSVVPKLATVYKSMDIELPVATRILIGMSDFVANVWLWLFLVIFVTIIGYNLARQQRGIRHFFDRVAWSLPAFGPVVRNAQEAFFFQYLALVYRAGIPLTHAIARLIETTENRYFRGRLERIPENLRTGVSLRESFDRCKIFQPLDIRMVSIGEQTGSLDAQLVKLATIYMGRVHAAVEMLTKAIEPMLMVFTGALFAFFVVAMLGPIYILVESMISQLGGQG